MATFICEKHRIASTRAFAIANAVQGQCHDCGSAFRCSITLVMPWWRRFGAMVPQYPFSQWQCSLLAADQLTFAMLLLWQFSLTKSKGRFVAGMSETERQRSRSNNMSSEASPSTPGTSIPTCTVRGNEKLTCTNTLVACGYHSETIVNCDTGCKGRGKRQSPGSRGRKKSLKIRRNLLSRLDKLECLLAPELPASGAFTGSDQDYLTPSSSVNMQIGQARGRKRSNNTLLQELGTCDDLALQINKRHCNSWMVDKNYPENVSDVFLCLFPPVTYVHFISPVASEFRGSRPYDYLDTEGETRWEHLSTITPTKCLQLYTRWTFFNGEFLLEISSNSLPIISPVGRIWTECPAACENIPPTSNPKDIYGCRHVYRLTGSRHRSIDVRDLLLGRHKPE